MVEVLNHAMIQKLGEQEKLSAIAKKYVETKSGVFKETEILIEQARSYLEEMTFQVSEEISVRRLKTSSSLCTIQMSVIGWFLEFYKTLDSNFLSKVVGILYQNSSLFAPITTKKFADTVEKLIKLLATPTSEVQNIVLTSQAVKVELKLSNEFNRLYETFQKSLEKIKDNNATLENSMVGCLFDKKKKEDEDIEYMETPEETEEKDIEEEVKSYNSENPMKTLIFVNEFIENTKEDRKTLLDIAQQITEPGLNDSERARLQELKNAFQIALQSQQMGIKNLMENAKKSFNGAYGYKYFNITPTPTPTFEVIKGTVSERNSIKSIFDDSKVQEILAQYPVEPPPMFIESPSTDIINAMRRKRKEIEDKITPTELQNENRLLPYNTARQLAIIQDKYAPLPESKMLAYDTRRELYNNSFYDQEGFEEEKEEYQIIIYDARRELWREFRIKAKEYNYWKQTSEKIKHSFYFININIMNNLYFFNQTNYNMLFNNVNVKNYQMNVQINLMGDKSKDYENIKRSIAQIAPVSESGVEDLIKMFSHSENIKKEIAGKMIEELKLMKNEIKILREIHEKNMESENNKKNNLSEKMVEIIDTLQEIKNSTTAKIDMSEIIGLIKEKNTDLKEYIRVVQEMSNIVLQNPNGKGFVDACSDIMKLGNETRKLILNEIQQKSEYSNIVMVDNFQNLKEVVLDLENTLTNSLDRMGQDVTEIKGVVNKIFENTLILLNKNNEEMMKNAIEEGNTPLVLALKKHQEQVKAEHEGLQQQVNQFADQLGTFDINKLHQEISKYTQTLTKNNITKNFAEMQNMIRNMSQEQIEQITDFIQRENIQTANAFAKMGFGLQNIYNKTGLIQNIAETLLSSTQQLGSDTGNAFNELANMFRLNEQEQASLLKQLGFFLNNGIRSGNNEIKQRSEELANILFQHTANLMNETSDVQMAALAKVFNEIKDGTAINVNNMNNWLNIFGDFTQKLSNELQNQNRQVSDLRNDVINSSKYINELLGLAISGNTNNLTAIAHNIEQTNKVGNVLMELSEKIKENHEDSKQTSSSILQSAQEIKVALGDVGNNIEEIKQTLNGEINNLKSELAVLRNREKELELRLEEFKGTRQMIIQRLSNITTKLNLHVQLTESSSYKEIQSVLDQLLMKVGTEYEKDSEINTQLQIIYSLMEPVVARPNLSVLEQYIRKLKESEAKARIELAGIEKRTKELTDQKSKIDEQRNNRMRELELTEANLKNKEKEIEKIKEESLKEKHSLSLEIERLKNNLQGVSSTKESFDKNLSDAKKEIEELKSKKAEVERKVDDINSRLFKQVHKHAEEKTQYISKEKELENKVGELEKEVEKLKKENEETIKKIREKEEREKFESEVLSKKKEIIHDETGQLKTEIKFKDAQIEQLEKNIKELKNSAEDVTEKLTKIVKLEGELKSIKEKNDQLESSKEEISSKLKTTENKLARKENELNETISERERLSIELAAAKKNVTESLERIQTLTSQKEQESEKLKLQEKKLDGLSSLVKTLKNDLEITTTNLNNAEIQIEQLTTVKTKQNSNALEELSKEKAKLKSEISSLELNYKKAVNQHSILFEEIEELKLHLNNLENEKKNVEIENKNLKMAAQQVEHLQTRVKDLEEKEGKLMKENKELELEKKTLTEMNENSANQLLEKEKNIAAKEKEIEKLLEQKKKFLQSTQVSLTRINELEKERDAIIGTLERSGSKSIEEFEEKYTQLLIVKAKIEAELTDAKVNLSKAEAEFNAKNQESIQSITLLSNKIDLKEKEIERLSNEIEQLKQENSDLRVQIREKEEELREILKEVNSLRNEKNQLLSRIADLESAERESKSKELTYLAEKSANLESLEKLERLKEEHLLEIEMLKNAETSDENKINQYQIKIQEIEEAQTKLQQYIDSLEPKLKGSEIVIDRFKRLINDLGLWNVEIARGFQISAEMELIPQLPQQERIELQNLIHSANLLEKILSRAEVGARLQEREMVKTGEKGNSDPKGVNVEDLNATVVVTRKKQIKNNEKINDINPDELNKLNQENLKKMKEAAEKREQEQKKADQLTERNFDKRSMESMNITAIEHRSEFETTNYFDATKIHDLEKENEELENRQSKLLDALSFLFKNIETLEVFVTKAVSEIESIKNDKKLTPREEGLINNLIKLYTQFENTFKILLEVITEAEPQKIMSLIDNSRIA